jgi:hypothetical protein
MTTSKAMDAARRLKRLRRGHVRMVLGRSAGKGIVVMGMHRSGTSAAARTVNMLGPSTCLADDMIRGPWNPQGHYESQTIVELDNHLLAQMGCTWWSPPPSGAAYTQVAGRITTSPAWARRRFVRVHPVSPWVWKDPRAVLLIPFWRSALGSPAAALIVFRNPLDVASSLQRRHRVPVEFGLALWERYNRLLLAHARGMEALVVSYEDMVSEPATWIAQARAFLIDLRMSSAEPVPDERVSSAVEPRLSHGNCSVDELSSLSSGAHSLYRELQGLRGRYRRFEPPDLVEELPFVAEQLDTIGPYRKLDWRPPSTSQSVIEPET